MSMEKDFRLLCKMIEREKVVIVVAFKHPTKEKYVLTKADKLTDIMDDNIIIKNQIEAKQILKENYNGLAIISKNKLNKLMK